MHASNPLWLSEYCCLHGAIVGAEVISVVNNDENKTFGVVFRTPVSEAPRPDDALMKLGLRWKQ
jgi:hypothetical protein